MFVSIKPRRVQIDTCLVVQYDNMSDFPTCCYGIKNNIFNAILVHANKFVTCLSFYNEVKVRVGFR